MNAITYSDNLNASLDAPEIDPQHMVIANEMLCGKSIPQISELTGLSNDQVTAIAERSEVRRYVDAVYMSQGYLNRVRRMQVINKVIDEKRQFDGLVLHVVFRFVAVGQVNGGLR